MDSAGTNGSTCDQCGARRGDPFWINKETHKEGLVLKGTWCSWACYNQTFDERWAEHGGYPLELTDIGGGD